MKYLCMLYVDEKNLNALSKRESAELDAKSLPYDHVLPKKRPSDCRSGAGIGGVRNHPENPERQGRAYRWTVQARR